MIDMEKLSNSVDYLKKVYNDSPSEFKGMMGNIYRGAEITKSIYVIADTIKSGVGYLKGRENYGQAK